MFVGMIAMIPMMMSFGLLLLFGMVSVQMTIVLIVCSVCPAHRAATPYGEDLLAFQ
jgi:hypothetical protein